MTAAQPIDLPPLPKCKMLSGPNLDSLHALYTADQMRDYAALARQQPAASGAGEVAASDYLLRTAGQALRSYQYGNSAPDLAAGIADRIDAQLAAASAAPHAQAEPVGYISEGTRAMLAAGCSTPITISISTGKAAVWCAPMYLSVPVPQEAEQAAPAAVTDGMVRDLVRLWDAGPMPKDDYNDAMCAIEDRMRAYAAQPAAPAVTDAARDVLADAKEGA